MRTLSVLEERQTNFAGQVRELAGLAEKTREAADQRAARMGERFDSKQVELERRIAAMAERFDGRVGTLEARVAMYVQRYVGASVVVAAGWAVISHFVRTP